MKRSSKSKKHQTSAEAQKKSLPGDKHILGWTIIVTLAIFVVLYVMNRFPQGDQSNSSTSTVNDAPTTKKHFENIWIERAYLIDELFHTVYTPCWEGAYGAIGDAYLFEAVHDSALLRFHSIDHDMTRMCEGTWVDDRAWVCLAEMQWWSVTGRVNTSLVDDVKHRYLQARSEGRLANVQGFWSWYNYPPSSQSKVRIFTNSNMNQMVSVACWLYEATEEKRFLDDAMLVWNGDNTVPGIEDRKSVV